MPRNRPRQYTNIIQARIDSWDRQLTPTELAYLAGIIDGEGTITIIRATKKWRENTRVVLTPTVQVHNTNENLLRWLSDKLGMVVFSRDRRLSTMPRNQPIKSTPKTSYSMNIVGYRCFRLLQAIEPYLIIKREQAATVIRFIELRAASAVYNDAYSDEQQALWLKVRALNGNKSLPSSGLGAHLSTSTT